MDKDTICCLQHITTEAQDGVALDNIYTEIKRNSVVAIISEDASATQFLRVLAGINQITAGELLFELNEQEANCTRIRQYVPDDIVCYPNLDARTFLRGMSIGEEALYKEAKKLMREFAIPQNELLIEMTFENNRMVAMIEALMAKPPILLLDRPYDLLGEEAYQLLCDKLLELREEGTTIVLTSQSYDRVKLPCDQYIFLSEGKMFANMKKEELPVPAKVITLFGGTPASFDAEKLQMIVRDSKHICFAYEETDMRALSACLSKSGAGNYLVEDLTIEEMITKNYGRWLA